MIDFTKITERVETGKWNWKNTIPLEFWGLLLPVTVRNRKAGAEILNVSWQVSWDENKIFQINLPRKIVLISWGINKIK